MRILILITSLSFLIGCAGTPVEKDPEIISEIDVNGSVAALEKRWQGGNPYQSDPEKLKAEAQQAPIQIYGDVVKHLQINPPSIWRGDTRLLDFVVLGFMVKVRKVTSGAIGPVYTPTKLGPRGQVLESEVETRTIHKGDLVRVFLRHRRTHTSGGLHPAEAIARHDRMWVSYDTMPSLDLDPFVDDGVTPRMWTVGLIASRISNSMP